jgi:hypothetical protein
MGQYFEKKKKRGKPIHVRNCGGIQGCETSRLPHFLDNRLTDGGEVVSLTRRPAALYFQEDSWYSSSASAPATIRHVAYCLDQLRYHVLTVLTEI